MSPQTLFVPVLYSLLQLAGIVAIGIMAGRFGGWPRDFYRSLSRLIVQVAFPLYFFARISKVDAAEMTGAFLFPLAAMLIIVTALVVSVLVFRFIPGSRQEKRTYVALSSFGNSGMIPLTITELLPLSLPLFAEQLAPNLPSMYVGAYILAETPILWSIGNFLITGQGRLPKIREIITPPLVGILAGTAAALSGRNTLFMTESQLLFHLVRSLELLGSLTFPLILFILGTQIGQLQLNRGTIRRLLPGTLLVSLVRFFLMPGIFVLILKIPGLEERLSFSQKWILFLEMTTPPATNLSLIASKAGMQEDHVSFTILLNYLLYLLVLPLYIVLVFGV